MSNLPALALIGLGATYDSIAAAWPRMVVGARVLIALPLASTDGAADAAALMVASLDAATTHVFVAIDQNALNYARFDVYGRLRLLGFKSETLAHPSAIVESDVELKDGCWIGAGAIIGAGVRVGNCTFIGAGARVDSAVQIGANSWVGAGASIGRLTRLGKHCVVGADVRLGSSLVIGNHCVVDVPGSYSASLADGTFIDPLFSAPVRIYGSTAKPSVAVR